MAYAKTRRTAAAITFTGLFAFISFSVFAADSDDTPAPDKSAYTLFNPVPDDLMRAFSTDRPTKGYTPTTVDAGHFQYEADFVSATYDRYNSNHVTTTNFTVADPTLKMGLTQNTDLELALAPVNFDLTHDRTSGTNNDAAGFGDVYTRVKFNLFGNDGGDAALAIVPYVKAPAAAHNVGNNHWEGGVYAPFSAALPYNWSLGVTSEFDELENAALDGTHANYQNLINASHSLFTDSLTGTVEFWSDVSEDRDAPPQYTVDFALAWVVRDNLQLDAGINVGANKAAEDAQAYMGIAQRF